jgi:DNA-binding transcriptional ArsR family regulator
MATTSEVDLAALFRALSDPTRQKVVEVLAGGPRRAGELANAAGVSPPSMSRHLRVLLGAGLVVAERRDEDARTRVFRLRPESVVGLQAWLDQLKAHWDEQLSSFKRHVERTGAK